MRFADRTVVITGAARGIGFSVAQQAAREGASTVVCDLDQVSVDAAVSAITADGGRAIGLVGDVSDLGNVKQNVAEIMATFGRIDVLINNAGKQVTCPSRDLPEQHWRREIDINLTGCFFWAQSVAVAWMIPQRSGSIVNISSGAGVAAMPNSASYVAAKHGLVGLTKSLAIDWAQYNIRVNCVAPGFTWTDLSRSTMEKNPEMMKERIARIPLARGAEPHDVALAILFLASDDSASTTGITLSVDGGNSALGSGFTAPQAEA
jgi:NAD(P)-dependent dehydrogenase (short-subunit alcohol dehydrogenase family)